MTLKPYGLKLIFIISLKNKFCLFMGDFNIDLLKIDSHADSELSLIPWAPVFFHPHIKFKFKFNNSFYQCTK